jgi:hypothetical protein
MSFEVAVARPLAGRVILVTRAREQAAAFAALLEEAGGTVMLVPTIAIEPPDSWQPLDTALARAAEYRWAVFTSVNGVEMVRRRLAQSGRGCDVLASCRIAAIGPAIVVTYAAPRAHLGAGFPDVFSPGGMLLKRLIGENVTVSRSAHG